MYYRFIYIFIILKGGFTGYYLRFVFYCGFSVRPKLNVKPSVVKPAAEVKPGQKRKAAETAVAAVKPLNSASRAHDNMPSKRTAVWSDT